jgi:hypothetical protein
MFCQRSTTFSATAFLNTASTSSLTSIPYSRGVGRRSGFCDANASCMNCWPPSVGAPPRITSSITSAIWNTSVHGPVAPYVRSNCSGEP